MTKFQKLVLKSLSMILQVLIYADSKEILKNKALDFVIVLEKELYD